MLSRLAILAALASSVTVSVVSAQWINYPTPGIPRAANGKPNLTAPVPKMPDGKPNLQGIWTTNSDYFKDLATNIEPDGVPMLPSAKAIVAERETNDHKGDAMAQCMPPGVPRIDTSNSGDALHPFKIVQTPSLVVLLYETSSNSIFRQVFLTAARSPRIRSRPGSAIPSANGTATRSSSTPSASTAEPGSTPSKAIPKPRPAT
jgi:hypothetical protein